MHVDSKKLHTLSGIEDTEFEVIFTDSSAARSGFANISAPTVVLTAETEQNEILFQEQHSLLSHSKHSPSSD